MASISSKDCMWVSSLASSQTSGILEQMMVTIEDYEAYSLGAT